MSFDIYCSILPSKSNYHTVKMKRFKQKKEKLQDVIGTEEKIVE